MAPLVQRHSVVQASSVCAHRNGRATRVRQVVSETKRVYICMGIIYRNIYRDLISQSEIAFYTNIFLAH